MSIISEKLKMTPTEIRLLQHQIQTSNKCKQVPTPQNPKPSETTKLRKKIAGLFFTHAVKANYCNHSQEPLEYNILLSAEALCHQTLALKITIGLKNLLSKFNFILLWQLHKQLN